MVAKCQQKLSTAAEVSVLIGVLLLLLLLLQRTVAAVDLGPSRRRRPHLVRHFWKCWRCPFWTSLRKQQLTAKEGKCGTWGAMTDRPRVAERKRQPGVGRFAFG